VDRARLVSATPSPVQDDRGSLRRSLRRVAGSAVVLGATALKWAFVFGKFFAFFVSFALYSYLFRSWEFGLGLVLLILVHEMGHFLEAKRQHVPVSLPTFVPFFGAFVTIRRAHLSPWGSALVSLAGPFLGSVGAAVAWAGSTLGDAQVLVGLANIGFLLNAFNLLPIGFLDGGAVARAFGQARHGWIRYDGGVPVEAVQPDGERARAIGFLYVLLAAAIVVGLLATKHGGAI
jgi:membrane-associated protease RseP (regulator of RpoE activity)